MTRADTSQNTNKTVVPVAAKCCGTKCHFIGEQWEFLASKGPQFQVAVDNGTQGSFYKMMVHNFINKWGMAKIPTAGGDKDDPTAAAADNAKIAEANIDPVLQGTTSEAVVNESSEQFNKFARVNTLLLYM